MTAIIKHISLSLFALMIVIAGLQPSENNRQAKLSIDKGGCIANTMLFDHIADDFQNMLESEHNSQQTTSDMAVNSNCQSMSPFLTTDYSLELPLPAITGRTQVQSARSYTLLIDDRTSDPPKLYS